MFQLEALIDTSVLPSNIMSLRDDKFIDFVKEEAGDAAAALLEVQGINCVKSLLMTTDIYAIMNLNSKSLDGFKRKYGYIQDDNICVIQPGIKGNVDYLIDLLKQKCVDDTKLTKLSKRNQSISPLDNITNASSTITKSNSSISSNSLSETIPSKSSDLTINGHKKYIIDTLNKWCENNKSKFNVSYFSLIEGQDYFISMLYDENSTLKGNIKCCCEKLLSLTLSRGKFQLSNFYRHLQNFRNGNICKKIKEIINNSQSTLSSLTNNQETPSSQNNQETSSSQNNQETSSSQNNQQTPSSPNNQQTSSSLTNNQQTLSSQNNQQAPSSQNNRQGKRKVQHLQSSYSTRSNSKRTRIK